MAVTSVMLKKNPRMSVAVSGQVRCVHMFRKPCILFRAECLLGSLDGLGIHANKALGDKGENMRQTLTL